MAPVYPENTDVEVTVSLPFHDGEPLIPTAVTRAVMDQTGAIISPAETVEVPADIEDALTISIPAVLNGLGGVRRGARVVEFVLTTSRGQFTEQVIYLLEAPVQLVRLKNSFVTLAEAHLVRREMPALDGFDAADETSRIAALESAHRNLCRLTYRYKGVSSQSRITWGEAEDQGYTYVTDIADLTMEEWAQLPDNFINALQRAQLAEADVLLRGDPVGDKRRAGVISETIGESSMFFRQVPEIRMPVSEEALEHVGQYVYRNNRIARA